MNSPDRDGRYDLVVLGSGSSAFAAELARGRAVDEVQLATALETSVTKVRALLERDAIKSFVYRDEQGVSQDSADWR